MLLNRIWIAKSVIWKSLSKIVVTVLLIFYMTPTANAEDWQPTWSTATLSQARSDLSATSAGGKVFFGGGVSGSSSDVVDIYDTATSTWTTATLSLPRDRLSATSVGDKVFFGGGINAGVNSNVVDIYDTVTSTWSTATLSQARYGLSATSAGGKVFFGGGRDPGNSNVVDIYDTATDSWSTATLSSPRFVLSATSAGGKVFFGGGWDGTDSNVVDIYDTTTDSWSTATLSQPRHRLYATSAGDKVFIGGGAVGGSIHSNVVDIYDTATSIWSTATLSQGRRDLSATSLGDKVFFGGGYDGSASDVVDIYDTATDSWSTETLSQPRQRPSATSAGGQVFFGGGDSSGPSDVVDIYRPQQIYDSITSSKVFTLDDQTIVSGLMQHNAPGSLNMSSFDLTVGSMSGDAPIDLADNMLIVGTDNTSPGAYSGAITGGGHVLKVGSGKLTIGGLLIADVTIDGGRVEAATGAAINGNVTIAPGTRLINSGGALHIGVLDNNGILDGSAEINGDFLNSPIAEVRVGQGDQVIAAAVNNINQGTITMSDGTIEFEQILNNTPTGVIQGRGTLYVGDGSVNQGVFAFSGDLTDVHGDLTNDGGTIAIAGGSTTTFYDDVTDNGGTIDVGELSKAVFFGSYNGGTTGPGTVYMSGDLQPGNSPASVSFGGDLQFASSAQLSSELGGLTAGSQFDQVNVIGEATLSGTLDVLLINSFAPTPGDEFVILTYASHDGEFDSVMFPNTDLLWQISYGDTDTTVTFLGIPGDIDFSGIVDEADLAEFIKHYGTTTNTNWQSGDFNADGKTSLADLLLLKQNFGETYSSSPSPTAVPEPSAIMLAVLSIIGLILVGWRRRRRLVSPIL